MKKAYVHGYDQRENLRLQDQASTLVELLHSDTKYPAGSRVLEAGCGVGARRQMGTFHPVASHGGNIRRIRDPR